MQHSQLPDGRIASYRVTYEIDVDAMDPPDAARQVYEIFQDPNSLPPIFAIREHLEAGNLGAETMVDCQSLQAPSEGEEEQDCRCE